MKVITKPCCEYYIGTAREIRSLYRNMELKTIYIPLFAEEIKLNPERIYGIKLITDPDDALETYNTYAIIGETDVCYLLMGEV